MRIDLEVSRFGANNGLSYLISRTDPKPTDPIGNYGVHDTSSVIGCCIYGLSQSALSIIARSNDWLDRGLESQEYDKFGDSPPFHRFKLHWARALGTWLEDNATDEYHWNEACHSLEAYWRDPDQPQTPQKVIRYGLDRYMAFSVLGGCFENCKHGRVPFEAGIKTYEYWTGRSEVSLKKVLKPRELGYALCRHYLNEEFDRDEILHAGRRMLESNLTREFNGGWLNDGALLDAATWLMLIYWYPALHYGEPLLGPVDVLLKAYDDIPGVVRPF